MDIKVYDLPEKKCNRSEFRGHLEKLNPTFLVFHTHGDERTIFGNKNNGKEEVLVKAGDNEYLLSNKIVYSIACSSAKVLGKVCKSQVFIGYTEDSVFYYIPNRLFKPSTDHVAFPCLESTTQIPLSIIKGESVEESVRKSKERCMKHIRKQIRSKELEAPYILQALIDNMNNLKVIGDGGSVF